MSLNTILATTPLTSTNYVLKATGTTIGNSLIWDNGTNVGIGNTNTSYTLDVSGTGRFTGNLYSSTNILIGTTTVGDKLTVVNSGSYAAMQIGNGTNSSFFGYANASGNYNNGALSGDAIIRGFSGVSISGTNGASTNLYINSTGNVGIGTTSPSYLLDVNGTSRFTNTLEIVSATTQGSLLQNWSYNSAPTQYNLKLNTLVSSGLVRYSFDLRNNNTDYPNNLVLNNGNVGIGTASPSYKLDIIQAAANSALYIDLSYGATGGNAAIIANITTTGGYIALWRYGGSSVGSITTNGSSIAYNTTFSDVRLKTNFEDWNENVLDLFKEIKPILFNFINDSNNPEKIKGYIAQQEVDKFPEAYTIDYEGYHSFNPSGMVVYLMKAMKEAASKLDAQNQTIQNLQEQINILAK